MHLGPSKILCCHSDASIEAKLREGFLCVACVSHSGRTASHSQGLQRWLMGLREGWWWWWWWGLGLKTPLQRDRQEENHWEIHSKRWVQTFKMTIKEVCQRPFFPPLQITYSRTDKSAHSFSLPAGVVGPSIQHNISQTHRRLSVSLWVISPAAALCSSNCSLADVHLSITGSSKRHFWAGTGIIYNPPPIW